MCTFYYPEEGRGASSITRIAECDSVRTCHGVVPCFASAWLAVWSGTGAAQLRETSTPEPSATFREEPREALEYIDDVLCVDAEPQRVERAFGSNCGG